MMNNLNYQKKAPCTELIDLVDSFWMHHNPSDKTQVITIAASSFSTLVFYVHEGEIVFYVITGVWMQPQEIHVPPNTTGYGCRMKILAPEFLIQREVASLFNTMQSLDLSYLNIEHFALTDFERIVEQLEIQLLKIRSARTIPEHILNFSRLLYTKNGEITPAEVAKQIFWSNRQINRYLNKHVGISLSKYLNIQKCNGAFVEILQGDFSPIANYFDQPHLIREVKKYTGTTPKKIYQQRNDRFIQLRNLTSK